MKIKKAQELNEAVRVQEEWNEVKKEKTQIT